MQITARLYVRDQVAWINRRGVALDPSVPRPDYIFPDLASLLSLVET